MESYTIIDNDIWKDHNIKGYEKLVLIYLVRNIYNKVQKRRQSWKK